MTLRKHLVQIVDDDHASQRALRGMLEANDFRVVTSDTCMVGEREAASRPPDAMIVSMGVPDRNGNCLIRAIRTWSPAPILVLSAHRAKARRLAAFDAGADDYILTPSSAISWHDTPATSKSACAAGAPGKIGSLTTNSAPAVGRR